MQVKKERRSNADRTQFMRDGLIAAARELFVEKGYGETSTPEIVARANVTRGALYHHFEDKASLFRAVITAESERVAEAINLATQDCTDAADALNIGTDAYLDAMTAPGRTRLLLIDGPAALGREVMDAIDRETSGGTMVVGLTAALGRPADARIGAHASLLAAAFDRAALDINAGGDPSLYRVVLKNMLLEAVEANRA
ncbi:MAG: putative transcriptional regulator [Rhizobium sp.]|nr:putative transcriptional regulator [Rhizobium sp.]